MSALLLADSFAPIALALSVPVPETAPDLPVFAFALAPTPAPVAATPRDETMPKLDASRFPTGFVPPAKSWTVNGGAVFELGALGSRRFNAPDVVHLTLGWDF